jgi:hypothetical protein
MANWNPNFPKDSRERYVAYREPVQRSVNYELHVVLALTFSVLLVASAACNFSAEPSKVAEDLIRRVEQGKIEEAMTSLSNGFISRQGIESVKQGLSQASRELKEHGGVKSIVVLKRMLSVKLPRLLWKSRGATD